MKKFALLLSLVFVAGVAVADEAKKPEAPKAPEQAVAAKTEAKAEAAKPVADKGKTHEVTAEVVSVDATKNTITLKGEKGKPRLRWTPRPRALSRPEGRRQGHLTCWDNAKGEHVEGHRHRSGEAAAPKQ